MDLLKIITLYGLIMIVCGAIAAILAGYKNRNISAWVAWGFLVPPSLIILLCLSRLKGGRPRQMTMDEEDAMMDKL
ncbi:MAG: hypothetical protein AAFW82_09545 [Pseudomonadota bacterium]